MRRMRSKVNPPSRLRRGQNEEIAATPPSAFSSAAFRALGLLSLLFPSGWLSLPVPASPPPPLFPRHRKLNLGAASQRNRAKRLSFPHFSLPSLNPAQESTSRRAAARPRGHGLELFLPNRQTMKQAKSHSSEPPKKSFIFASLCPSLGLSNRKKPQPPHQVPMPAWGRKGRGGGQSCWLPEPDDGQYWPAATCTAVLRSSSFSPSRGRRDPMSHPIPSGSELWRQRLLFSLSSVSRQQNYCRPGMKMLFRRQPRSFSRVLPPSSR
jgi:hypothetical protein